MLFGPESQALPAPPISKCEPKRRRDRRGTRTGSFDRVRRILPTFGSREFTSREVATLAGITREQAAVALYGLSKQGIVERLKQSRTRTWTGRQVYRWNS
jgi:hypothetical protein